MSEKIINLSDLTHFLPRQIEATKVADDHTYTLYGGSAGPGKSYWLRWYPIRQLIRWGQQYGLTGIRGGLFSQDYTTLKDRQISKMEVEFPRWLGKIKNTQTDGLAFHLDPKYGGHVLALRNLDDPSKYLSSEFAIIAMEELTENEVDKFQKIRGRLRWTGIPDPKLIAATNPGGVGHAFVKQLWIDRSFTGEFENLAPYAEQFAYVKALPSDNPYLAASYLQTLDSLPEKLRKAYRDGNWDVFEGQYFTEWDRTKHVVAPFALPLSWPKFRSIDPSGRDGITSCHWYALDSDGRVYVYREYYYGVGVTGPDGVAIQVGRDYDEHARAIAALSCDEDGVQEDYRYTVIDTAAFAKAGFSETAAEIFERNGVGGLVPATKERVIGWNAVHTYLRWSLSTPSRLQIFSTCANMIRTLPLLQHDAIHPEDVDSRGEDHAADELRYFLRTLREAKAAKPETLVERRIRGLRQQEQAVDYSYSRK
jgi:hypothetical protein